MNVLVAGGGPVARGLASALAATGAHVSTWRRGLAGTPPTGDAAAAVLAVSDGAIGEVAELLVEQRLVGPGAVLLHTAGAVAPEEAFAAVRGQVRAIGLLHPLRAFAGGASDAALAGTVFGIAGDAEGEAMARRLVERVGGRALPLSSSALPRYHAAAVLVSNHSLALVEAAVGLLGAEGLDRAAAEGALASLLASAAANVAQFGLPAALTGPIARGDVAAVARHLAALPPSVAALYRATGRATLELARSKGRAEAAALDGIARLLAEPRGPQ